MSLWFVWLQHRSLLWGEGHLGTLYSSCLYEWPIADIHTSIYRMPYFYNHIIIMKINLGPFIAQASHSLCRGGSLSHCRCCRQTRWHRLQICTSRGSPGFYSGNCSHCVTQQYSASTPKTSGTHQVTGAGREISVSSCVDGIVKPVLKILPLHSLFRYGHVSL